jgi:hypothetical protein
VVVDSARHWLKTLRTAGVSAIKLHDQRHFYAWPVTADGLLRTLAVEYLGACSTSPSRDWSGLDEGRLSRMCSVTSTPGVLAESASDKRGGVSAQVGAVQQFHAGPRRNPVITGHHLRSGSRRRTTAFGHDVSYHEMCKPTTANHGASPAIPWQRRWRFQRRVQPRLWMVVRRDHFGDALLQRFGNRFGCAPGLDTGRP